MTRILRRRGTETLEFALTVGVMLFVFIMALQIFLLYANLIVAQHALTQTALRVGATGSWSVNMQNRCINETPGAENTQFCELYYINPTTGLIDPTPIGSTLDPTVIAPLNSTGLVSAEGTRLRLRVQYDQTIIKICLPLSDQCLGGAMTMAREIDFLSQTRRQPGAEGVGER